MFTWRIRATLSEFLQQVRSDLFLGGLCCSYTHLNADWHSGRDYHSEGEARLKGLSSQKHYTAPRPQLLSLVCMFLLGFIRPVLAT